VPSTESETQTPVSPDPPTSVTARRVAVARRLIARGIPTHTLEALLPGWEEEIRLAGLDPIT
jgi:hypothetical protein